MSFVLDPDRGNYLISESGKLIGPLPNDTSYDKILLNSNLDKPLFWMGRVPGWSNALKIVYGDEIISSLDNVLESTYVNDWKVGRALTMEDSTLNLTTFIFE